MIGLLGSPTAPNDGRNLHSRNQAWVTYDRIPQRSHFNHFHPILTRPHDNDINGHIAGATVHGYFETAIRRFSSSRPSWTCARVNWWAW